MRVTFATLLFILLLTPAPAHAEPVSVTIVGLVLAETAFGYATAVAVTTFILTTTLSLALSFAVSALLRPSAGGKSASTPLQSTPYGSKVTAKSPDQAHPIIFGETRIGLVAYPITATQSNKFLYTSMLATGHKVNAWTRLWIKDEVSNIPADFDGDGFLVPWNGYIRAHFFDGDPDQAANADWVAEIPEWTADHRGRGIARMDLRLQFGPKGPQPPLFSDGVPNFTAVIQGVCEAWDPRDSTYKYTTNPALLAAWFLCNAQYGFGLDYATCLKGPSPDYPGEAALIAAANACDQTVTRADGSTGPRYTCNGALLSSQPKQDILGRILGAMAGWRAYDGETHFIYAGVYQSPTDSFTNNDLRGQGMVIDSVSPIGELFNTVRGKFFGEVNGWQSADFPQVQGASYLAQDGREITADIELPLTNDPEMCQRIAKIHLEKSRRQYKVKAPCKFTAWRTMAGNTIAWTELTRRNWSAKPFEVRQCDYVVEVKDGEATLNVDLQLQETAPGVYSWSSTEATILAEIGAPALTDINNVVPPTNLDADEVVYTTLEGGGLRSRVDLSWGASPDAFVDRYQVEWKRSADTDFIPLPLTTGLVYSIENVPIGLIDLRVTAVNYHGRFSPYLTGAITVTGVGAPPEDVDGLTVLPVAGLACLRWTLPEGDAVRSTAGGIEFRHAPVTSGATWATATPIGEPSAAGVGFTYLPLKPGQYLAKYFVRMPGGVRYYSANDTAVYTAQIGLAPFTALITHNEDPTFSGTKTQLTVASSKLKIISGKSVGTYTWGPFDLGSVKKVRVTIGCAAQVVSNSDLVDNWADVDSRPSWDTVVSGHEATVKHFIVYRDDDPSNPPNWSQPWRRIDSAEFENRAFLVETHFESLDDTWNIEVSALSILIEELT